MSFLAPSLLLGLLAAVVPWLVHLIGKRRALPVRFAAMQLLLRSERRISARRRLREMALLLARTGVAAALPLIFSRPFVERTSDVPVASLDAQSAVIIVDDSASMQRTRAGRSMFERARAGARALVRQFPSDADVALLPASLGSTALVGELSAEHSRAVEALDGMRCTARAADFTGALRRASVILASSKRVKKRIYVYTDLQAAGWEDGAGLPDDNRPEVIVEDVTDEAPWANRAVTDLRVDPAAEAGANGIAVTAEISDFTDEGATALGLALKVDGAAVAKGFVDVAPGGRARKRFLHALAVDSGSAHDVEVEIDRDGFPLDDRRTAHVELSRTVRVLVVNGDPRTVRNEDEPFFFETALRNGLPGSVISIRVPDDVTAASLRSHTAVALLNWGAPGEALATALQSFVEKGGGLFISMGGRVDAPTWNQRLGRLLPQPLGLARTAAALPGQSAGEILDDRPAERLAPIDRGHPLLAAFPERGEGLISARFFKYVLLDPVPDGAGRTVILRYESGAPALVEKRVGKGRVLLLSTTVDREWTDLPIRAGFLPLVRESMRYLVGAPGDDDDASLLVGEARPLQFNGDEQHLEVTGPDGSVWVAHRDQAGAGGGVLYANTNAPGLYRVRVAGQDGNLAAQPERDFVVNLDPRESNPARLAPEKRPDRVAAGKPGSQRPKYRVELWHVLAALLIGLILVESALTVRWRRTVLAEERAPDPR